MGEGSGFRDEGLGFRVARFRVWGLGPPKKRPFPYILS